MRSSRPNSRTPKGVYPPVRKHRFFLEIPWVEPPATTWDYLSFLLRKTGWSLSPSSKGPSPFPDYDSHAITETYGAIGPGANGRRWLPIGSAPRCFLRQLRARE